MKYDIQFTNNKPVIRFATGYTVRVDNLLAKGDSNTKLAKSAGMGFITRGLSLAPHRSTIGNVCPHASPGCIAACLFGQGRAAAWNRTDMLSPIAYARIARNLLWHLEREWFLNRLHRELDNLEKLASLQGLTPCCRLNMFSDIPWERFGVVQEHSGITFYDYSKWPTRYGMMASNYWVLPIVDLNRHDKLSNGHCLVNGTVIKYLTVIQPTSVSPILAAASTAALSVSSLNQRVQLAGLMR